MIFYDKELIDVEDIFENDELVLMKSLFRTKCFDVVITSVGLKDENGDIYKIIDVNQQVKK